MLALAAIGSTGSSAGCPIGHHQRQAHEARGRQLDSEQSAPADLGQRREPRADDLSTITVKIWRGSPPAGPPATDAKSRQLSSGSWSMSRPLSIRGRTRACASSRTRRGISGSANVRPSRRHARTSDDVLADGPGGYWRLGETAVRPPRTRRGQTRHLPERGHARAAGRTHGGREQGRRIRRR